MDHPTTQITHPSGYDVAIDIEIAALINCLWWDHQISTDNSCQDNHGYVWISFDPESAQRFLGTVVANGPPALRYRAADPFDVDPHPSDRWKLKYWYHRPADSWLMSACVVPDDLDITISIRFPRKFLKRVEAVFVPLVIA